MMLTQNQVVSDPANAKLINNGYLHAPHITNSHLDNNTNSNNSNNSNTNNRNSSSSQGGSHTSFNTSMNTPNNLQMALDSTLPPGEEERHSSVVAPLLGGINATEKSGNHEQPNKPEIKNQGQNLLNQQAYNALPNAVPTVVYLGNDISGVGGGGVIGGNNAMKTTTTTFNPLAHPQQQQQQQQQQQHYNKRLLKDPNLRRRLFLLAIAFTMLGVSIGALAFYLADSYRCHTQADFNSNALSSSSGNQASEHSSNDNICLSEDCVKTAALLLSAMDTTVDPCEDFFKYACGTWNKNHLIPEDRSSISTFEVLADQLQAILKGLLEEPFNESDNQATIKAKTFYKSCMDLAQIREKGVNRLKEVLRSLGGWPVIEKNWTPPNSSVEELLGILRSHYNEQPFVDIFISADDKNSSVHILQLDQLQLALPSRDYYLNATSENHLHAYLLYMKNSAVLLGADADTALFDSTEVLKLEKALVNVTLPEHERHDTGAQYKKTTLPELQSLIPQLNWTIYLQTVLGPSIPLEPDEQIVTLSVSYLMEMGKIIKEADRRTVHNYAIWKVIMSIMAHLLDEYQRESVEFRKILMGIESERSRWSQCVEWTNKKLGIGVGALFVKDNFNQESKETALEMIHDIREAFIELLAENIWMDDETRAVAREKADSMNERIGYPDLITNITELENEYANLTMNLNDFMENILNIFKWESEKAIQLLRQPVDKEKWTTEPAVVNAFYNPNRNDIVFPAGILQPIFYSKNFPKSLNYGGIGVVIGHEITHGFDDKGRQYDKEGNLKEWWNDATINAFRERTQCIIDQYSNYKLELLDMYINGRMTQGENIADNGGLKQAFRAFKKWEARHGPEKLLPGLNHTHEQLFFLNYAQIWCGTMRPEDALTKIRSSSHSPGPIRVLGPLSNSKDFSKAYQCKLGTRMNPINKCSVW